MKRDELRKRLESGGLKKISVTIKELDAEFYIRELSLAEIEARGRDREKSATDLMKLSRSLAEVLVDEEGAPLYDHEKQEDVEALSKVGFSRITKLLDASNKLSGMDEEAPGVAQKN
jgi:hypothetical protein